MPLSLSLYFYNWKPAQFVFLHKSAAPISEDTWSCLFIVREREGLFELDGETAYAVNQNVTWFLLIFITSMEVCLRVPYVHSLCWLS